MWLSGAPFCVIIGSKDLLAHGELTKSRSHSLTREMIVSFHILPPGPSVIVGVLDQQMTSKIHFHCAYGWGHP